MSLFIFMKQPLIKNVRIESNLHQRVKLAATKDHLSVQQWVADACKKALREGK